MLNFKCFRFVVCSSLLSKDLGIASIEERKQLKETYTALNVVVIKGYMLLSCEKGKNDI